MGPAAATHLAVQIHHVDGHDLCRVHVRASPFPVPATITVDVKGQMEQKTAFFVRVANGTKALEGAEQEKYVAGRWERV
jgi:type I restriction enzyme R subunit